MMFCVATYWCLPLHIEILLQKYQFYNDCLDSCSSTAVKSETIYLPKKVCIIIIHANTTHILDMSSCHKHQQQRYHNENSKTCMFIHYMYVDIFFPLKTAIPIMLENVTTHYQMLQTRIGHNATRYHNFNALPHTLPHALPYIFSQFNMNRP